MRPTIIVSIFLHQEMSLTHYVLPIRSHQFSLAAVGTTFTTPITDEPSKDLKKCKLSKKVVHYCTFDIKDKSLLEAIGYQLCKISGNCANI